MLLRYFGGKSKIAKNISNFINNIIEKGYDDLYNTSEGNKKYQDISLTSSMRERERESRFTWNPFVGHVM